MLIYVDGNAYISAIKRGKLKEVNREKLSNLAHDRLHKVPSVDLTAYWVECMKVLFIGLAITFSKG